MPQLEREIYINSQAHRYYRMVAHSILLTFHIDSYPIGRHENLAPREVSIDYTTLRMYITYTFPGF